MAAIIIASSVSALATVVIAIYAHKSHRLCQQLKSGEDKFRQQTSDLYQAIVISNLLSGPSSTGAFEGAKNVFNSAYKGTTPIF